MLEKNKVIIKTIFLTLVSLFGAAILVYAGYWYGLKTKKLQVQTPSPSVETKETKKETQTETTAGWQTYVNQKFHYSIQFPPYLVLEPLAEGDNPFTEAVEVGDEGTFISEKQAEPGKLKRSMFITGISLSSQNKNLTLAQFVETQGSFVEPCHQDKPQKTQAVVTQSGVKGIKVWYPLRKGCQGAGEGELNDPFVFFDGRPQGSTIIELFENQIDEEFDTIVSTFDFIGPQIEFGD